MVGILTGAGVVDTEIALVHAAGRGKLGIGEAPLHAAKEEEHWGLIRVR